MIGVYLKGIHLNDREWWQLPGSYVVNMHFSECCLNFSTILSVKMIWRVKNG
jgi:hypothetical protein